MPRTIMMIGTLHAGITPNDELDDVMEELKPDKLLVEMADTDILAGNLDAYHPEMIFALQWARRNGALVAWFDSKTGVFRSGATPENNRDIIEKQELAMGSLSWRDCNTGAEGEIFGNRRTGCPD